MPPAFSRLPVLLLASATLLILGAAPAPEPPGLASTARQLQAIHPAEERDVPPAARSLMTAWKQQIRDFIGRELNGGPYQNATAERISDHLKAALAREGVPVRREPSPGTESPYGWIGDLEVLRPAGHDRLLAVTVTQDISCGSDASLYLFQLDEQGWHLAFALESNGYEQVNGGLGTFQFGVSPPDKRGGFFLVAASVNPWCSSSWQGIRYRAYRVGGDPLRPTPFLEETAGIFEWDYTLTVEADRFRVTFPGSQSLDVGILIRDYVRAFRVTGTRTERIGPLAKEPQGFIDEWIGATLGDRQALDTPPRAARDEGVARPAQGKDKGSLQLVRFTGSLRPLTLAGDARPRSGPPSAFAPARAVFHGSKRGGRFSDGAD